MGTPEGRERQAKLVAFARRTGMRLMGPNCNGVINYVDAFAMASTAAIAGPRPPAGDIGVVSHSGGFGQISVMWRAMDIGLRISYEASVGNEADLDSLDFARFMLRSDATRVILMAIEGDQGRREADRARARGGRAGEADRRAEARDAPRPASGRRLRTRERSRAWTTSTTPLSASSG